jgi:hypothetical protein
VKENVRSERIVLFASLPRVLIHTVLARLTSLDPPNRAELGRDFVDGDASWRIAHVTGGGSLIAYIFRLHWKNTVRVWRTVKSCSLSARLPAWAQGRSS